MAIPAEIKIDKIDSKNMKYDPTFNNWEEVILYNDYLRNSGNYVVEKPADDEHMPWESTLYDYDFIVLREHIHSIDFEWNSSEEMYAVDILSGSRVLTFQFHSRKEAQAFHELLLTWRISVS